MIVIYNPTAGRRRVQRLWLVLDILAGNGVRFEVVRTLRPGHATEIARQAIAAGAKTIVAAGGDGTIADVAAALAGSDARLGIIPLGTANVLAHELGMDFSPPAIAACLAFGRSRDLWPGIAEGPHGTRLFVQMLGAGFDAQVVHRINTPLKRVIGKMAYVTQTLCELMSYKFPMIEIEIDGKSEHAASVIVSKGRLYGGPFLLAPHARTDQPGFIVTLFRHGGQLSTLLYGAALPLHLLPQTPGVELRSAAVVTIHSGTPTPVQADGDRAGYLPLTIRDAPGPIPILLDGSSRSDHETGRAKSANLAPGSTNTAVNHQTNLTSPPHARHMISTKITLCPALAGILPPVTMGKGSLNAILR